MKHNHLTRSLTKERGASLVITLLMIVLLTVVAVAFFARSSANSSIETVRVGQVFSAQISESGAARAYSPFLAEIASASNSMPVTNASGLVHYLPLSATKMIPACSLALPSMQTNENFANLIRQSVPGADALASTDNSATPSKNGRTVSAEQWNDPALLPVGFTTEAQLPRWIYINKDGRLTNVASSNSIGRFAYNSYDLGGLLDANVAGYPSSVTAGDRALLKGTLAGADLTLLPGVTQSAVDKLITFRNPQATNSAGYRDYVSGAVRTGFLSSEVTNGSGSGVTANNFFNSRQDLIRYVRTQNTPLTNALPYLTHFTRELARPSLNTNGLLNMTNRFDLSRLTNISTANTGLSNTSLNNFTYTRTLSPGGVSTNPNFFEILRAAITYTNTWENNPPTNVFSSVTWTTNTDLKAVAIGANIIDLLTTSSQPVRITYASNTVAGKKQLPYVSRIFLVYNTYIQTQSNGNNNNNKNTNNNSGTSTNWMNGKAVGNPGTGNNGNDRDRGNTGEGNTFWITFSIIPQVYSPVSSSVAMTARVTSGSLALGNGTISVFSNTAVTISTNVSTGCTPVYAANFSGNSAALGFLNTSYGWQGSITNSPLTVSLTGLSFALNDGSGRVYTDFGTNSASASNGVVSAPLSFSITLTNITSTTTDTGSLALDGVQILTVDPRTPRGAGATNRMPSNGNTNSLFTNIVPITNNYAPAAISDTNWATLVNGIRSVGELGSVFRESPWRTINFVSGPSSADRNLLDTFSAYPTPASGIRAGVLNLNTPHAAVLASLLSGTVTTNSGTISPASAGTYASNMVAVTSVSPLTNRAQLVDLVSSNVIATTGDIAKQSREAAIRTLAEPGQTRTWNLLLDVVAQTGKIRGSAAGSNFIVEGERRIWVTAAVDRLTGRIIDSQTEEVNE